MKSNYILLSYHLDSSLSAYGNGPRIEIHQLLSLANGDTSNNTSIEMPAHFGTHIDFPKHFIHDGKSINDYRIDYFIFNKIKIICLDKNGFYDNMITEKSLTSLGEDLDVDLLLVNTGHYKIRNSESYWKDNPGFSPEVAKFVKKMFPNIRAIGFDTISLSGYQNREVGRLAHKEFLSRDILIIEDMNFSELKNNDLKRVIAAPLWVNDAEGTPVTFIGELND